MNIKDIARLSGVSVATVSRVINNQSAVSQKSREKVLAVMAENHFTPNIFARGLNAKSTKTIGILCPEMNDINHAKVVSILEHLLRSNGFDSLLCCTGGYRPYNKKTFNLLTTKQVDAIFTIGSFSGDENDLETYAIVAKQIPIIVINGYVNAPGVYNISCDEKNAVYNLVMDLYKKAAATFTFWKITLLTAPGRSGKDFLKLSMTVIWKKNPFVFRFHWIPMN